MRMKYQPIYKTIKCSALTDGQLEACSALFSANYGEYSGKDKAEKQGKRIKLPVVISKHSLFFFRKVVCTFCQAVPGVIGTSI